MKVTAFLGSPRNGGNTDILTQLVLQGAHDGGYETEMVALRDLSIHDCIGCEKCWQVDGRPCVFKDDMIALYETIAATDVIVFATPVYWYAPTAAMKAFIDRFVPFNRPQGRPLIQGKRAILVTAYEEDGPGAAEPMIRMFEMSFSWLNAEFAGRVVVDGVGPKAAVIQKPDALEQAYQTGLSLGSPEGSH